MLNYTEAAKLLLRRSYPDIFNGTQVGPEFIPETFLPSYTRSVDFEHFEKKMNEYHKCMNPKEREEILSRKQESKKFKWVLGE